jgi:hypothetical protein
MISFKAICLRLDKHFYILTVVVELLIVQKEADEWQCGSHYIHIIRLILGAFAKLRKATISFKSICPSVLTQGIT